MLDQLGVYTGREPSGQTAETTVATAPDSNAAPPQTPQPQTPAPQTSPTAAPPATAEPTPQSGDLIGDLSKAFAKSIGEMPSTAESPKEEPPTQQAPAEPSKPAEKTWRDQEPPAHVTKKVQEDWRTFKEKAKADVDARDARIKGLENELAESKKAVPTVQGELEQTKKALDAANQVVERVAIERSPLFRSKVTEPLELIKGKQIPSDPFAIAKLLYDVVNSHMTYSKKGSGWGQGDAVWACESKYGNCTDFHSLFISLARSQKMPAKFECGFPIAEKRGEGVVGGYHCWAWFRVDAKGWVPVDISEANKAPAKKDYFFGNIDENRFAVTTGRDVELTPKQDGPPLNFFIFPYVEIDGKEHGKQERAFSYRDVK